MYLLRYQTDSWLIPLMNADEYQRVIKRKTEEQDPKSFSSVSVPGAGVEPALQKGTGV